MLVSRIFINALYAYNYRRVNACTCTDTYMSVRLYLLWCSLYKNTSKVSINLSFDVHSPSVRVNFCRLPTVCRDNRSLQGEQTVDIYLRCSWIYSSVLSNTKIYMFRLRFSIQNNSESRNFYRIYNIFFNDNLCVINSLTSFKILQRYVFL